VDVSESTPGWKFNHWESVGVPIRIEIGSREISSRTVTICRRDTGKRSTLEVSCLPGALSKLAEEITLKLSRRSRYRFHATIHNVSSIRAAQDVLRRQGGMVGLAWCGEKSCGMSGSDELTGGALGYDPHEALEGRECWCCGKTAQQHLYYGRTY
jgi:prolyl-tRNA synthetase